MDIWVVPSFLSGIDTIRHRDEKWHCCWDLKPTLLILPKPTLLTLPTKSQPLQRTECLIHIVPLVFFKRINISACWAKTKRDLVNIQLIWSTQSTQGSKLVAQHRFVLGKNAAFRSSVTGTPLYPLGIKSQQMEMKEPRLYIMSIPVQPHIGRKYPVYISQDI